MTHILLGGSIGAAICAVIAVALGAALGGALRYALAELAVARTGSKLPGTWCANMIACLVGGVAVGIWAQGSSGSGGEIETGVGSALAWAAVMVGFAGGLSTWSTLAGEIVGLARQHFWRAAGYVILTLIDGTIFAFVGIELPPLVAN